MANIIEELKALWIPEFSSVNAFLDSNALTEISREGQCWHVLRKLVRKSDKHFSISYSAYAICSPKLARESIGLWHPIEGIVFPHQRAKRSSLSSHLVLLKLKCATVHPLQAALLKRTPSGNEFHFGVFSCCWTHWHKWITPCLSTTVSWIRNLD